MNSFTASGQVSGVNSKRVGDGTVRTLFTLQLYGDDLSFVCSAFGALGERAAMLADESWIIASGRLKSVTYDSQQKILYTLSGFEQLGDTNGNEQ